MRHRGPGGLDLGKILGRTWNRRGEEGGRGGEGRDGRRIRAHGGEILGG